MLAVGGFRMGSREGHLNLGFELVEATCHHELVLSHEDSIQVSLRQWVLSFYVLRVGKVGFVR